MSPGSFKISQLAIPAVSALIIFLAYTSQYFCRHFEAVPLTEDEVWWLNGLTLCIWICYYRACTVDPGRVPRDWKPTDHKPKTHDGGIDAHSDEILGRHRWCRRCEAFKPPRAHHCKTCGRCIPKMDHHCPWTSNCVSFFTFPHFIRFLFYAVAAMGYLESMLYKRASSIWTSRRLPSYLGPSIGQMIHLFLLIVLNSLTLFALAILLVRSLWSLGANETTIETWEKERHSTLVRRARHFGGYLDGPGGIKIRIKKQEFPYDIGIWANIKAGMGGTSNVLSWFWPLAATPNRSGGLEYQVNGFEDPNLPWPPPDPDRIPRPAAISSDDQPFTIPQSYASAREEIEAFQRRQAEDLKLPRQFLQVQRRRRFHDRYDGGNTEHGDSADESADGSASETASNEGEEAWRNSEGERLRDFGVDEDIEFYDEEDIPVGILIERRHQRL